MSVTLTPIYITAIYVDLYSSQDNPNNYSYMDFANPGNTYISSVRSWRGPQQHSSRKLSTIFTTSIYTYIVYNLLRIPPEE